MPPVEPSIQMDDDTTPDDSVELDEELERLKQAAALLHEAHVELKRTLEALAKNRRTPQQIRDVIGHARSALHRSALVKLKQRERRVQ